MAAPEPPVVPPAMLPGQLIYTPHLIACDGVALRGQLILRHRGNGRCMGYRCLTLKLGGHVLKASISGVTVERQPLAGEVFDGTVILVGRAVGAVERRLFAGVPVYVMAD